MSSDFERELFVIKDATMYVAFIMHIEGHVIKKQFELINHDKSQVIIVTLLSYLSHVSITINCS